MKVLLRVLITLFLCCAGVQPLFAQYDDGARYAFSTSTEFRQLYIFDVKKQSLAHQVSITSKPGAIAASEQLKALIISYPKEKKLTLINLAKKNLPQINYPLNIRPDYIAVSPIGETVAVYDRQAGILEVHAIKRKTVLMKAEGVYSTRDFTFNLDGSKIYWVDHKDGYLNSVDLWSKRQKIRLSENGEHLSALSRSTDGRLGFVSDAQENLATVIDLKSFKIIKEIFTGVGPTRPWGTADGQLMLVPNTKGTLTAISTLSLDVIYTTQPIITNPISVHPGWLDTTAAVIGQNGKLVFIDTASGRLIKQYDVDGSMRQGIVTADSKTLTVPTSGAMSGAMLFFDMRTKTEIGKIENLPVDISRASLAISNNLCH